MIGALVILTNGKMNWRVACRKSSSPCRARLVKWDELDNFTGAADDASCIGFQRFDGRMRFGVIFLKEDLLLR